MYHLNHSLDRTHSIMWFARQWTADGLITACAPELVVAELSLAHAATRHLRMAARFALGTRPSRATSKHVQVCIGDDKWVLMGVVYVAWYGVDAH